MEKRSQELDGINPCYGGCRVSGLHWGKAAVHSCLGPKVPR